MARRLRRIPPGWSTFSRSRYAPSASSGNADSRTATQASDPSAATVPGLIKAVEVQLLSSDLSTSVLVPSSSARRAVLTTLTPASARTRLFAGGRKDAVLVQVQRVQDVAHSAGAASEVLREKGEARRMAARGAGVGGGGAGRIMDLGEVEEDGVDEPKVGVDKVPVFPRGSARLVLSDGETEVVAFERELIPGLGLEEIKLGTKVRPAPSVSCRAFVHQLMPFWPSSSSCLTCRSSTAS